MRLLTPPGVAGVAVVHVEPAERAAVLACLRAPGGGPFAPAAAPRRAALLLDGAVVDDVLVLARGGALELHTHGAPAVLDQLDRRFGVTTAAPASPAERLLREALSVEQFDLACEQLGFDFEAALAAMTPAERAAAARRSRVAAALVEPRRVVLIGRQNAGKSSLFNLLLFRERALTGATAGLTRDPVAECTTLDGYPYELVDTAGEGAAPTELDRAAIAAGRALRDGALRLLVVDGSRPPSDTDLALARDATIVVRNKLDLGEAGWPADLPAAVSASCVATPAADLRARIGARLREVRGLPPAGPVGGLAALDAAQRGRLGVGDGDG